VEKDLKKIIQQTQQSTTNRSLFQFGLHNPRGKYDAVPTEWFFVGIFSNKKPN